MSDDLIKRLRSYAPLGDGSLWSQSSKDIQLAADEIETLKQQVEQGKRDAVPEGFTIVAIDMLNSFPEINPSNYDHDDACALNAWGVEFVSIKRDAVPDDIRKDAERYRWLRDGNQQIHEDDPCVSDSFFNQYFESDLDNEVDKLIERNKAIDAAPKQEK